MKAFERHRAGRTDGNESLTPHEIETRVRHLTIVAANLFKRGAYEPAFESLMKAYLLDPGSPHVVACEKTLLPALEMLRQRGSFATSDSSGSSPQHFQLARLLVQQMERVAATPQQDSSAVQPDDKNSPATDPARLLQQRRIEALKQKHEQAKKEREQRMWRDASSPPKILTKNEEPPPPEKPLTESQKLSTGLLAKLKQGKFFG